MSDAPQRILDAARRRIAQEGIGGASLQEIAAEAGVSKPLLLYHFGDKAALLARLATALADALVAREGAALGGAEGSEAIDALWRWLAAELERGDLRVLAALGAEGAPLVRDAMVRGAERRREAAAHTVSRLFALLGLRPRVAPPLLADVVVAFVDGLAVDASARPAADQRVRFDVFWLAMLSLAE